LLEADYDIKYSIDVTGAGYRAVLLLTSVSSVKGKKRKRKMYVKVG